VYHRKLDSSRTRTFALVIMVRIQKIDLSMSGQTNPSRIMSESTKTIRCTQCKKKLGLLSHTCKCGVLLCISHLPPQEHACTYDFKKDAKAILQKQMDSEPRACSFERID